MIAILRHVQIRLGKVNKTDDLVSENCVIGFIKHTLMIIPGILFARYVSGIFYENGTREDAL